MKPKDMREGAAYVIVYYDHFEGDMDMLILTELGFYINQTKLYIFVNGYRDSEGTVYNRSGIIKSCIIDIQELSG